MKNIHVLPTDKPSRLFEILKFNFVFDNQNKYSEEYKKIHKYKNQNIYITSDSEIKEGDWVYCRTENRVLISNVSYSKLDDRFKIILTTDQDLIAEGVQSIDDTFLEWFVNNPSCEEVEVKKVQHLTNKPYRIIIPQEEPKQELGKELFELEQELDIPTSMRWHNSKSKQETLEEYEQQVLEKYYSELKESNYNSKDEIFWISNNQQCKQIESCYGSLSKKCICVNEELIEETIEKVAKKRWGNVHRTGVLGFIEGAKWQAERMYSEEEVLKILLARNVELGIIDKTSEVEEWFNRFKKK